jgi:protein associated with RNAse G/E
VKELERRIKTLEYELIGRWEVEEAATVRFISTEEFEERKRELGYPDDYTGMIITDILDGEEVRCDR